jgi:hypothetical protein
MKLMAIDPGLKGGVAIFDDSKSLMRTYPMLSGKMQYGGRGKKHRLISLAWLRQLVEQYDIADAVLEVPSAMPGQSSVATATAFTNWGLLLALAPSVSLHCVYPGMWKKHYTLGKAKTDAIRRARFEFKLPNGSLSDGEAEAALIGRYWFEAGSERERANLELQKSRPRRRKRKAKAPAPKRRAARPSASSPAPPRAQSEL